MAVEAVVSVVLQKLTEMLNGQSLTQNKYISYEVQDIMKSLNSIRDLMISTKEINQQAEEYLNAVYNVEDTIEKFTLVVVRQRKVYGFLTNHIFFFNNLNSCQKIHQKIKKITTQLMQLKAHTPYRKIHIEEIQTEEEKDEETVVGNHKTIEGCSSTSEMQATNPGSYMEELTFSYSCNEEEMQIVGIKERFQKMSSFSYKEEELGIFGLKEDVEILVKQLTKNSEHFVSIVGQGGIGKTTLARTIYKNRNIKCHFQFRAWVSVLEEYTTKDILLSLFKTTDTMTDKTTSLDDEKAMKLKLSDYFKNKRYLIILDGASTCNIWKDIKETFPDVKNGSKVVFTSTQTMETTEVGIVSHHMMPLNEDDSLKMFKKKVGKEESWPLISETSKKAIVQSCNGLPLNIVLLAGLFSMKDPNSWCQVFSCMKNSNNILSLCYNDLTDHLKVCLLYSVLFPKEFDIPVRRLLRLWLAEGFVKQNSTIVFPEDIAETYFDELVNRNMIQISKLRSDNSPRRCRVLGVLHDYLWPKAQETNLFYTYRNLISYEEVGTLNIRRMVEYESSKRETRNQFETEMSKNTQLKSSSFNPSHLRSYVSFNHQKTDYRQAKRIGSFLGNIINDGIGLLRVLDLEGVYKPILPENLGNLCNLRYLGLRSTYLDSLPPSVGELTHLETLDVKHTCIDELPGSIWRLKNLQHLNLNETCLDMQPHSSLRLLTLWGLFLDKKIAIKNGLDKLHDLRELGITFQPKTNQDDLMDWIGNLEALRSLRLRSKDNLGRASKLVFRSMSNLRQLSHLNLLGNLEKLPDQNEFPPTLKVLTLSISLLKRDPMQTLGQLPCLTVLRLLGESYIGKEMVCRKGGFSKLRLLRMWKLKELKNWFVEEGSMENLKHLDIRCCDRLSNIPTTLLQQQKLEKLVLTGMPHRFTTEVERLKSDHTSMTINHWKFPPLPWEQDDTTLVNHS
ncbi:putative inactive disease susceptibility protein LOV1 [Cynara cardunculus var. scolymus]|uniref:putative inactive disease susceptibility protein LOV1 n=1 Tax=Cynara cardunculus var. scolymus TaxID=59895 RepID=UPI000D630804|nr:putative inactive disease susceptibility protein LOV1 [Cynara cardunculus var. scolymus]